MAERWHQAELDKLFPDALRDAVSAIDAVNDQITTAYSIIKAALEAAKLLADLASQDPIEAALRQAIEQIEAFLDGLLEGTTAHAIMIPIQKQYFGLGEPIPPNSVDPTSITPSFDDLVDDGGYAQQVVRDITPESISFVNTTATATGGNQGYWRELVLSLYDSGDFAKPDFPSNFAVTGACVVFGSENLADLYKIIALLNRLLNMGFRADMAARSQPAPSTLSARIMPMPTKGTIGVQLDWAPIPPVKLAPLFSGEQMIITDIFVIRSTDAQLRERFSWGKVFSTEPTSSNDLVSNVNTRVIASIKNDGFISRYIDDSDLDINQAYYYAIALRYRIGDVVQPMSLLSNVVRVFYDARPGTTRFSEPPDWFATPSLVQLFPILETINSKIKLFINGLLARTASNNGIASLIDQTIQQIEALLAQGQKIADELQELENLLRNLANADTATGIYTTTFDVSRGGMQAWTGELARRLSDGSDPTRPPFDGHELVAGFVIVAGAPTLPRLEAFRALLELFFGSSPDNPFKVAFDSMGTPPPPTAITFDGNMVATRSPATSTATTGLVTIPSVTKPQVVFDSSMKPAETADNC